MVVTQIFDVLRALAENLGGVPEVDRVILFGSRARGDARERSDVDLAIEAPRADAHAWSLIVETIDESRTLLSFDVVRLERAAADFRAQILLEGVVLFERRGVTSQSA